MDCFCPKDEHKLAGSFISFDGQQARLNDVVVLTMMMILFASDSSSSDLVASSSQRHQSPS